MKPGFRIERTAAELRITLASNGGNQLTLGDVDALADVLREATPAQGIHVVRLMAEGPAFCRGRRPGAEGAALRTPADFRTRLIDPIMRLYSAIDALEVPALAQVHGDAEGLGCALVGACDIAVAARAARFRLPEMEKNLPPTLALSVLAPRISPKTSASMVFGMLALSAEEARAAGLLGEVVDDGHLAARCDEIVGELSRFDPVAVTTARKYLRLCTAAHDPWRSEAAASMLASALAAQRAAREKAA